MSLSVNTNVASLNAQRNLGVSSTSLNRALERLSSGFRINRAGDDAAGLSISESLRSQVRGLRQAVRNANDGLSLVGTAEGAISEVTNLIQRIRELAVQSSNGTNSQANRTALQAEVTQLTAEIDRIATTTQFNGRNLLDGSFTSTSLQVGANVAQTISVDITSIRAISLGATATYAGSAITAAAAGDLDDLTINGIQIANPVASDDTVSTTANAVSAIALAAAINASSGQTNVTATVNAATTTGGSAVGGGTLNSTNNFTINGVTFNAGTIQANDADGALQNLINAQAASTGVTASISGNNLVLTAADGRNIQVTAAGTGATITGVAAAVYKGSVTLSSLEQFTVGGSDASAAGHAAGTKALNSSALNAVNISTFSGAQAAITTADAALAQVNAARAGLGAVTNRLESTIANLQTTAENLSASESRIRDADFAQETAALTRAQILQQAGVAILAQANVVPQAALSLLR
ncbi:MAG: flagellin [Candidatus Sumerlaeia bacterium]|nr:flagellin [Actinobacteria bacterium ATB1]NUP88602.1 flagellin [Candidatus Sumerlaeia bacterium]